MIQLHHLSIPNTSCRINNAINENTRQLQMETNYYIRAVEKEQDKQRSIQKALLINAGLHNDKLTSSTIGDHELIQSALQSFEQDISNIDQACQEHEKELANLNQMLMEQAELSETLAIQQDELLLEYNSLEKEAKVFEDIHHQLTQQCHSAEIERSHLHHVRLNSALFDIFVDDACVLYPLINNLRLSHRPKADLQWVEINTAWSQVAQLLTFMSNTVKFTSQKFGIIPLMDCANIYVVDSTGKKVYHRLGGDFEPMDKKLQLFLRLFNELIAHLKTTNYDIELSKIPYEMTANKIGKYNLQSIEENNDLTWKIVINHIMSNMKWLSALI